MGEAVPPTAADYAHDTANQAVSQAKANAGAFEMLLELLWSRGVMTRDEYQAIMERTLWR